MVLECGIGGRLDATNVVESPVCSAITTIGLDHMDVIGDTLEEIAWEKAGVIKHQRPCVIGPTAAEMNSIAKKAKETNSELIKVPLLETHTEINNKIVEEILQVVA